MLHFRVLDCLRRKQQIKHVAYHPLNACLPTERVMFTYFHMELYLLRPGLCPASRQQLRKRNLVPHRFSQDDIMLQGYATVCCLDKPPEHSGKLCKKISGRAADGPCSALKWTCASTLSACLSYKPAVSRTSSTETNIDTSRPEAAMHAVSAAF